MFDTIQLININNSNLLSVKQHLSGLNTHLATLKSHLLLTLCKPLPAT